MDMSRPETKPARVRSASGKNKIRAVILTANHFEDLEVIVPYFRLLEEGIDVVLAAPTLDSISGEHGYMLKPDKKLDDINPDDFDLLIIPGGFPNGAPATVRRHPAALAITRAFFSKNKPVASICHGPWTLASAGVVRGRKLTSFWHDGVPEDIQKAGGLFVDKEVVVDKNLVTSRWPPDLPLFTHEMMKLIGKGQKKK